VFNLDDKVCRAVVYLINLHLKNEEEKINKQQSVCCIPERFGGRNDSKARADDLTEGIE
jgi:hypothetical protein